MGQDWPKGDEPACGDFIARCLTVFAGIVLIVTTMLLGGCDQAKCKDGETRTNSYRENTFEVCVNGKWKQYENPEKPKHRTDV